MTDFPVVESSIAGSIVAVMLYRMWRGAKNEGTLDQRILAQLEDRDNTIKDREERIEKLNDRYHELATTHGQQIIDMMQQLSAKHDEAIKRFHERLDECEKRHDDCRDDVEQLKSFVLSTVGTPKP